MIVCFFMDPFYLQPTQAFISYAHTHASNWGSSYISSSSIFYKFIAVKRRLSFEPKTKETKKKERTHVSPVQ